MRVYILLDRSGSMGIHGAILSALSMDTSVSFQ
jgi:uncharacterized protein with von Willebrand factor type A (vWA) domain